MSSPVHSTPVTSQSTGSAPPRSPHATKKGNTFVSFTRTLRARAAPGLGLGRTGTKPGDVQSGRLATPRAAARGAGLDKDAAVAVAFPLPARDERRRHDDGRGSGLDDPGGQGGLLDPLARSFAHSPLHVASAPAVTLPPNATLVHLDQMMTRLVRKVAWGGNGRRGAARVEIGAGELAGAIIIVQSDNGALSVDMELPAGAAADVWRERLGKRFKARGLDVVELNVR